MIIKLFAIVLFIISTDSSADISKSDFMKLNKEEQNRLLESSYQTSYYFISHFVDNSTKQAPRDMYACMRDRNVIWLRNTYVEFQTKYPEMATMFSQNLKHAIAWKCGLLTFADSY